MKTGEKNTEVEDDDDVVIIGDIIPKPMLSQDNERHKRQVEFKKSISRNGSLVITQKVKVKKRKHKCVLNSDTNVNEKLSANKVQKNKKSESNTLIQNKDEQVSSTMTKACERFTPVCTRQNCQSVRCPIVDTKNCNKKEKRIKVKSHHHSFPRGLKRLLSPISPLPMKNDSIKSVDCEISLDTSSFTDEKESKLDTLIKRTRERDRNIQMARTQYLHTPPPAEVTTSKELTQDKNISTDHKPLYTSTPIYEENIEDNEKKGTSNNNCAEKSIHNTFLKDIQGTISPIPKSDTAPVVSDTNHEQNTYISHNSNLTKQSNSNSPSDKIKVQQRKSEYTQTTISSTNYEESRMSISYDSEVFINQINEGHQSPFFEDVPKQNNYSENTHNPITKTNVKQNLDGKVSISHTNNVTKVSQDHRSLSNEHIQYKKSECTTSAFSETHCDQNMENEKNTNNDKKLCMHLHMDHGQFSQNLLPQNLSEYARLACSNNIFYQDLENKINLISHDSTNYRKHQNFSNFLFSHEPVQHNKTEDLQNDPKHVQDERSLFNQKNNIFTAQQNLGYGLFCYNRMERNKSENKYTFPERNYGQYVEDGIMYDNEVQNGNKCSKQPNRHRNQFFEGNIQDSKPEYRGASICNLNYKQNTEDRRMPASHEHENFRERPTNQSKHEENVHKKLDYYQSDGSHMNYDRNIEIPYNHNNFTDQTDSDHDTLFEDRYVQYSKSEYKNTAVSNVNVLNTVDRCTFHENNHYIDRSPRDRNPHFDDILVRHQKPNYIHTGIPDIDYDLNFEDNSDHNTSYDDRYVHYKLSKYEPNLVFRENQERNTGVRQKFSSHENKKVREEPNLNRRPFFDDIYLHDKKTKNINYADNANMDCEQNFDDRMMSMSNNEHANRDFENARHRRSGFKHTAMNKVKYEQNVKERKMTTTHNKNYNCREQPQRRPRQENKTFDYRINSGTGRRNLYKSYNNYFTEQIDSNHSPLFEDIDEDNEYYTDIVEDRKISVAYKAYTKKKVIQHRNTDHTQFDEGGNFRHQKWDSAHSVHSKAKYEKYSHEKRNMFFGCNNNYQRNKVNNFKPNLVSNQHKKINYMDTISNRNYKKGFHKQL